jgi:indole-3-glycerol phosphate synthase
LATQATRILAEIVESRRRAIASLKTSRMLGRLEKEADAAPATRDFAAALRQPQVALIAEAKQRSPSAGWLMQTGYDPADLARRYLANGAAAVSVLTEPAFFNGSSKDLKKVRTAVDVPLLCKDFILDESQLIVARANGADAVLLIVSILDSVSLPQLHQAALARTLQVIVEVHDESEVERALEAGAQMIGINNRDLKVMKTDKQTTVRLRPLIPKDRVVISESGIASRTDVEQLADLGVNAVLVGEAILRAKDLEAKVRELAGR